MTDFILRGAASGAATASAGMRRIARAVQYVLNSWRMRLGRG